MSFYTGLQSVAANLLASKGQLLTFNRDTETAFDAGAGEGQYDPSTYTGNGVALNYNKSEIDGTIVVKGDIKLILEATTTVPLTGDRVTIDGVIYRMMPIKPTSPAGTVVIYEIQLRK